MILIYICISLTFISCEEYNEDVFEIVGTYDGNTIGFNDSFIITIASDYRDDIIIEAPFDGQIYDVVIADVDCEDCDLKEIDIDWQEVDRNVYIQGTGAYSFGTIQIDYEIEIFGVSSTYTMIGSKY